MRLKYSLLYSMIYDDACDDVGEEEEEYGRSTVGPSMKVFRGVVYLACSPLSSTTP